MKKLSFKKRDKSNEIVTLDDGIGVSIDIPKLGHVTVFEELAISEVWSKLQNSGETYAKLKLEALAGFLRNRLEDDSINADILAVEAGSQAIIDVLYSFMENERSRWVPSANVCKIEGGTQSRECAKIFAEKNGYVAATRPDLKVNNTYLIFKKTDDVPEGFEIEFDYSLDFSSNGTKKNEVKTF